MSSTRHQRTANGESGDAFVISPLAAIARYPWTIIVLLPVFLALALIIDGVTPPVYSATAEIIVEDPRASTLFQLSQVGRPSTQASERYLADQVAIIRSSVTAGIAVELSDGVLDIETLLENREVEGEAVSNLIEITVESDNPNSAKLAADSLASAYLQIRRQEAEETGALAIAEIDGLLKATDESLGETNDQIERLRAQDLDRAELEDQFRAAVAVLNDTREQRSQTPIGSPERAAFNEQLAELLSDFEAWQVILATDRPDDELDALLRERDALVAERATLAASRNSITVGVGLASRGITLYSPAPLPDRASSLTFAIVIVAMTGMGLIAAAALSFYLASKNPIVTDRLMPQAVFGWPLLGTVPDSMNAAGLLPALTSPTSDEARAFRFASSAIELRASTQDFTSVLFTSVAASLRQSAIVANLSISAVSAGLHLLLIDADFRDQRLTQLLESEANPRPGTGSHILGVDTFQVQIAADRSLSFLSRARKASSEDPSSVRKPTAPEHLVSTFSELYDLVIYDGPSLFDASYAGTLAAAVDSIVVIVQDRSALDSLEELGDRLDLINTEILGYLYVPVARETWLSSAVLNLVGRFGSGRHKEHAGSGQLTGQ